MKYIFTALMLVAAGFAEAQIVNIPDSNFKRFLISRGIDTNSDGEIEESEALTVSGLRIVEGDTYDTSHPITNTTGLKEFKNIEWLEYLTHSPLVDIGGLSKLKRLELETYLSDGSFYTPAVEMPNCTSLEYFSTNARLTQLNMNGCNRLKGLGLPYIDVYNFNPGILDSLEIINLMATTCRTVNLTGCKSLKTFYCHSSNSVKNINLSGLTLLNDVSFGYSHPETISLKGCTGLQQLGISTDDSLREVNVLGCTSLESLTLNTSNLLSLDLSLCPSLRTLSCSPLSPGIDISMLKNLNLKNGTNLSTAFIALADSANVCADESEIDFLKPRIRTTSATIFDTGPSIFNINPYCNFVPGGVYNIIHGKTRSDLNNNGCDDSDMGIALIPVRIKDSSGNSVSYYTNSGGSYTGYSYKGTYTISPYFPYPYFTINPLTASVAFDSTNNLSSVEDFCIRPNGSHNDLEITFLPTWPPARPGFNAGYTLIYKNRGTTTLSGNVQVNFDNSKMNFISASENISSQNTGQLTWAYNNLQPFETKTVYVTFNLLPPPVNNIGDTITYLASITPSNNDETAFDNSFVLPQLVRGSMDPNEKQCLEGKKLDISKIGEYLHYQIHFQNEGTDTAFNIVVADTLSDKLDWNTLELISSSHPVDVKLNNNKAEFIFENIRLPYKAINEPGSNGWVAFKIKPKPSVVISDSLNNTAAIYFDFNKPVITNTATTIVSSSSTPVPVKLEYFSVNQKDNHNLLYWKASCSYGNAIFVIERSSDGIHFSSIGNIRATATRCQLPFNFTDNNPAAGKKYYRLKITDADGISFYSKTLVIGNNKAGISITAVAQSVVYLNSNKQQTIQLKLIAADGKEILNERKRIAAGANNISMQLNLAAKGIYTLIIYTTEGEIITKRILK